VTRLDIVLLSLSRICDLADRAQAPDAVRLLNNLMAALEKAKNTDWQALFRREIEEVKTCILSDVRDASVREIIAIALEVAAESISAQFD
jgi:DNA-binding IclR family transcriptional regulator